MRLQLKRSNVLASGSAKTPTASQLEYGELAINYNTDDPAIFLKDSNNNVIRISGVGNIADDGQVELPATTTPPSNPQSGNLWYNSDDGRLYIYYTDADSSQWVDASPDSWDPTVLPDTTNSNSQSGTLDDRYLMLNSGNDPITGGLNITGGNVGIGTSNPTNLLTIEQSAVSNAPSRSSALYLENNANCEIQMVGNASNDCQLRFGTSGNSFKGAVEYRLDENALLAYTNGSERVRINASGKVGIGTISPQYPLDVSGNIRFGSSTGYALIQYGSDSTATDNWHVGSEGDGTFRFYNGVIGSGSERMRITSSGNVGIGTSIPASKLHLSEGTGSIINLGTGTSTASSTQGLNFYGRFINGVTPAAPGQLTSFIREVRQGSNAEFDLTFGTGDTSDATEKMRLTADGNMGIGTSEPLGKLNISSGNISFTPNPDADELFLENTDNCGITIGCGTNKTTNIYFGEQGVGQSRGAIVYNTSDDSLALSTAGLSNERMRITSAGRLGIGRTDPRSILHVGGSQNTDNFITFGKRASANETNLPVIGHTSTNGVNNDLGICTTSSGGAIRFYTGNNAAGFGTGSNDERFRIDASGNAVFFAGGINPVANNSKGIACRTAGNLLTNTLSTNAPHQFRRNTTGQLVRFHMNSTGHVGSISVTATATSYSTTSDYRLKENIVNIDNAFERVLALKPRRFNFILNPEETVDGFIAHEAKEIVPECVEGEKDAVDEEGNPVYQGIDQAKLVPLLTAALQEAITRIEALENAQ